MTDADADNDTVRCRGLDTWMAGARQWEGNGRSFSRHCKRTTIKTTILYCADGVTRIEQDKKKDVRRSLSQSVIFVRLSRLAFLVLLRRCFLKPKSFPVETKIFGAFSRNESETKSKTANVMFDLSFSPFPFPFPASSISNGYHTCHLIKILFTQCMVSVSCDIKPKLCLNTRLFLCHGALEMGRSLNWYVAPGTLFLAISFQWLAMPW